METIRFQSLYVNEKGEVKFREIDAHGVSEFNFHGIAVDSENNLLYY